MSTASAYLNPANQLGTGIRLYRKLPVWFRLLVLSMIVFSASVLASFAQSALRDHQPISTTTSTTFKAAAQTQPGDSGGVDSGLAATEASTAATPALQQNEPAAIAPAATPTCTSAAVPYQTTFVNDPKLPQGEQNVAQYGENGTVVSCPGQAPQTTPAQDEVIHVGTASAQPAQESSPGSTDSPATRCEAPADNADNSGASQDCAHSSSHT